MHGTITANMNIFNAYPAFHSTWYIRISSFLLGKVQVNGN